LWLGLTHYKTEWRRHSANEDAVSWLTSYGSRNAYEKKQTHGIYKHATFVLLIAHEQSVTETEYDNITN